MNNPVSALLLSAKEKISDPEKWCQRSYALDEFGDVVEYSSPLAVKFCSLGALQTAYHIPQTRDEGRLETLYGAWRALDQAAREYTQMKNSHVKTHMMSTANDTLSHREVMAIWDLALETVEKEEENVTCESKTNTETS